MEPITAAILGGSALLGGLFGFGGQNKANRTNMRIAAEQNRLNYQMFKEANEFNLNMWNKQNEYNTPEQQVRRLEAAGINPALAMSNINTGMAEKVTSLQAAPAAGAHVENSLSHLGAGIAAAGSNIVALDIEKSRADAQNALDGAKTAGILSQNKFIEPEAQARLAKMAQDKAESISREQLNLSQKNRVDKLLPHEISEIQQRVNESVSRENINKVEEKLKQYDLDHLKPLEKKRLVKELIRLDAATTLLVKQGKLTDAQAAEARSRVLVNKAQAWNLDTHTRQLIKMSDDIHDRLLLENDFLQDSQSARVRQEKAKAEAMEQRNSTFYFDKAMDYGGDIIGMLSNIATGGWAGIELDKNVSNETYEHTATYDAQGNLKGYRERSVRGSGKSNQRSRPYKPRRKR